MVRLRYRIGEDRTPFKIIRTIKIIITIIFIIRLTSIKKGGYLI